MKFYDREKEIAALRRLDAVPLHHCLIHEFGDNLT